MKQILLGSKVLARDARDQWLPKRALGELVEGQNYPSVLVCTEEEWQSAVAEGDLRKGWAGRRRR